MLEGLQKVEVFKRCNKELIENISKNILLGSPPIITIGLELINYRFVINSFILQG